VVKHIAASGGEALAVKADCSKVAEIDRMIGEVIGHFGTVDHRLDAEERPAKVEVELLIPNCFRRLRYRNGPEYACIVDKYVPEFLRKGGGKSALFQTAPPIALPKAVLRT
jgi:hypothetical protein